MKFELENYPHMTTEQYAYVAKHELWNALSEMSRDWDLSDKNDWDFNWDLFAEFITV